MDGSIEGDINELSYSPIVVTVYFVWVRSIMKTDTLEFIHLEIIHSFIHSFSLPIMKTRTVAFRFCETKFERQF